MKESDKTENMDRSRWFYLMNSLGIADTGNTFDLLLAAYSEKHRHYHTTEHIDDCLVKYDSVSELAENKHEVELAIWFHDAIYKTRASDNELKSADWAKSFLLEHTVAADIANRVHALVMATRHEADQDLGHDARLLIDIDLSILASDQDQYLKFEKQIRHEYKWVPSVIFRNKRREILNGFLQREYIYSTPHFIDLYESKAIKNLEASISSLSRML